MAALAATARYAAWLREPLGEVRRPVGCDAGAARSRVVAMHHRRGERPMTDAELVSLLRCYGIDVVDFRLVGDGAGAVSAAGTVGYPVVMKSADQGLRHREDRIGVRLDLTDDTAVATAYADLAAAGGGRVYVQRAVPPEKRAASAVFAVTADPSFGALVSFGLGGVATELLDDRAYRAVPLTDRDAADLIAAPRAAPLLDGYRGAPAVDRAPLVDLVQRVSALADDLAEVRSLELRPVLIGPRGFAIAGVTGRIGPPPAPTDERRRLGEPAPLGRA